MPNEPATDLYALADLCTPWCLHVVATLRIADHIAAGTDEITALATAAGCDAAALHAVLTWLAGRGVFEEPSPGRFALNDTARPLLDPSVRLGLDLEGIGGRMAHTWGTLLSYVRTGQSAYGEVFGMSFFEDLQAHPAVQASFDAMMGPAGHGVPSADFAVSSGWESLNWVVDVGGGTGAFLAEILRRWPHLRGTLVDLPGTVAPSGEMFRPAGVAERAEAVGQSFFEPLPAGADLYVVRKVLNDWPEPEARTILERCAEAARPAGRVVVLRSVVPDGTPRPISIEMLLVGGRQRTVSEFRELASAAGLEVIGSGEQASGDFAVECRPAMTA
jgi:2,7-dihydroxy-5-methyl-1-naphthoate 7-O-methyltransferase